MKRIAAKSAAVSILLCGGIAAGVLAACQRAAKAPSESTTVKEEESGKDALTVVSFNKLITEEFVETFCSKYPDIKLEMTSYGGMNGTGFAIHSLENGDIPDIYISTQNYGKELQEKYLLDLSNYDFVNNYSSVLLDSMDVNGSIYLLPSGYQLTGIYYNRTILEENGWEVPKSFEELVALSQEIEAAGYKTMGHGMSLDGYPFNYFFNIGNTVYFGTPEGTEWKEKFLKGEETASENSQLRKTAEYFNRWVEHGFITTEHMDVQDFYEGKCVFFMCLGLNKYESTVENGKIFEFGNMPWLSEDGSNNMLTRTVSRYIGINKSLAEHGNEQKLEDALEFMDYISTAEGQRAFMTNSTQYMPSLNEGSIPQDSPYLEIEEFVNKGRTVPLVYVGWEKLLIPIAQEIKELIKGNIDVDTMLEGFDKINYDTLTGSSEDIFAVAEETLTIEKTAELVAIAEGKAADADCAMISLNEYHGNDNCNEQGIAWYIYKGSIDTDHINMFRPRSSAISVLQLAGEEIKEMQKAGFDQDENGNPYDYLLFTKNNKELEADSVYRLAISSGELPKNLISDAREIQMPLAEAIKIYLKELDTVRADRICWE